MLQADGNQRLVQPEWLDELPANDLQARGSRQDLKRLNRWMGHARIVQRVLRAGNDASRPKRFVELGAGDGDFLLRVARRLGSSWKGTEATLVDRHKVISEETSRGFRQLEWRVSLRQEDVFSWCRQAEADCCDVVMANLFLHHFEDNPLRELLGAIRQCSRWLIALEPRRSLFPLAMSNLVWVLGCNAVTRHDAPVSVRAGFSGAELSALWSRNGEWVLQEQAAGIFSHLFVARKKD